MTSNRPGTSEFEGKGVKPFGGFGLANAWEKLRFAMRTEQDPDDPTADLNAKANKFEHGGIDSVDDIHLER